MSAKSIVAIGAFCALAGFGSWLVYGQASGTTVSPSSGKAMCSALTAADFAKAGVQVSGLRQANLDGTTGAYCVYDSKAGNVEFDIFFPAGDSPKEVLATERTALGEVGGTTESVHIAGADDAQIPATTDKSAGIVVRKGKAVFVITIPKIANVRQQMVALAQVVLGRLKQ